MKSAASSIASSVVEATRADNMRILWDVPMAMDDGVVLRADVFLPDAPGRYAAILSYGPYGKGLAFQAAYKSAWDRMVASYPEIAEGSSNKYQNWEVVDPEKWVVDGYVCVRIDSRGAGRSQGRLEVTSARETQDLYQCVEWAAAQEWSNGKVGLNGISYYAMNQWTVAALQPPHLAAICVWEGAVDAYRDGARHGGILCQFQSSWFKRQVLTLQHGFGERGARSTVTGELVAGPETLSEDELAANRVDTGRMAVEREMADDYYRSRSADLNRVVVPLLSAANWGGMGLHTRGNFEGYLGAASQQKWLEVHGNSHFTPFYRNSGVELQKRFFGHFLQGKDTGWTEQPPVQLHIRRPGEHFTVRNEREWPLARTQWTRFYLDPGKRSLSAAPRRNWRSPGRLRLAWSCRQTASMPICSWRSGCLLLTARKCFSSAPTIRGCRSVWAGFAPHTASSIPREALPIVPTIRTTRSSHSRRANRSVGTPRPRRTGT
jgi:putative CocE/NonD family hydrolase